MALLAKAIDVNVVIKPVASTKALIGRSGDSRGLLDIAELALARSLLEALTRVSVN